MAKSIRTIEKDGFLYEVHSTAINHGKDDIGKVEVPCPVDLDDLGRFVEAGIENSKHAARLYVSGKTIEMQRQLRQARTAGKVPDVDIARIFKAMSDEDKLGLQWQQIIAKVAEIYKDEQIT